MGGPAGGEHGPSCGRILENSMVYVLPATNLILPPVLIFLFTCCCCCCCCCCFKGCLDKEPNPDLVDEEALRENLERLASKAKRSDTSLMQLLGRSGDVGSKLPVSKPQ